MTELSTDELIELHDHLAGLIDRGDEEEAQANVSKNLHRVPEEVRKEMLARMFFEELVSEAGEIEAVAEAQKDSISAMEALQAIKKEFGKENSAT